MSFAKHYIVTGAAGVLGGAVAEELLQKGIETTGLGRCSSPARFSGLWSQCDLLDADSVLKSLWGADVVIHCASTPLRPENDRVVLHNLISAASAHHCHIVYVGICSMESAAAYNNYYRAKLADETDLEMSGVSYSIVRISQFHPYVSHLLSRLVLGPLILAPTLRYQPVDVLFAAQEVCGHAIDQTKGRTPNIHGPEELAENELIQTWLRARNMKKMVMPVPRLGKLKRLGRLLPVSGISGGRTWTEWPAAEAESMSPYSW